jgi:hypothetical protein
MHLYRNQDAVEPTTGYVGDVLGMLAPHHFLLNQLDLRGTL